MKMKFNSNIGDGGGFELKVIKTYKDKEETFITDEGLAFIYNKQQDNMTTVGCMSTDHLEKAMEHIMSILIDSHKQKQGTLAEFLIDTTTILDKLDNMITEEVDGGGSMDDFSEERK